MQEVFYESLIFLFIAGLFVDFIPKTQYHV